VTSIGFPKPERRSKEKRRTERRQRLSRAQCRMIVKRRAKDRCERCGRTVTDDCDPTDDRRAHVNEKVPKSRGGSPYDPENCELLCRACHLPGGQHAPTAERMAKIQRKKHSKIRRKTDGIQRSVVVD
jgi:5-methylcytosine-specific restriction endonuclease McrA